MFVNNQELIYYSLLHQLLGFLPHLDVKLQIKYIFATKNTNIENIQGGIHPGYCLPEIFVNNKVLKVLSL
jgi:hypothetical protein